MATLISDLLDYIATQASLTVDTDLFLGSEVPNIRGDLAVLRHIPGSVENESGLEEIMMQALCKGDSYVSGKTLADTIYEIINHKPGFSDASLASHDIFYCEPAGMPYPIGRDDQAGYLFAVNFILRKR